MEASVRQKLAAARGRLIGRQFLAVFPWALLAGGMAFVLVRAGVFYEPRVRPVAWLGWVFAGLPVLVAWLMAVWCWRSEERVAAAVDAEARTKDRFVTILKHGEGNAMGQLLREEAERFIRGLDVRAHLPWRWSGKSLLWLVLPVALLAGLEFAKEWKRTHPHEQLAEAQELLEKVKQAAARRDEKEIERALEKKQEELAEAEDPMREALRMLAGLEEKLAQSTPGLSAAEAEELADALEANNAQLAKDLREGQQGEAAKKLGEMDPDALADALEKAEKHLQEQRMQQLAQMPAGQMKSTLQRMMQGEGNGSGSQMRAAIRDIKNGAGDQQGEGSQPNEAPNGNEGSQASKADDAPPEGGPGSEKDEGEGQEVAGEAEATTPTAADDALTGEQGDGASVVQMLRMSGADDPKARTAYRSAYQTAEAAALDAVNREEVPIGSRLLVRKYFEAIRPKE